MMKKNYQKSDRIIALLLLSLILSGCGQASSEKLTAMNDAFAELQETRTEIETDYDALYDSALFSRVTDAGQKLDALRNRDMSDVTDEILDVEILPALAELRETYGNLRELIDQTAEMEQAQVQATERKRALEFHVTNQSGLSFTALTWALQEETDGSDNEETEDTDADPASTGSSADTASEGRFSVDDPTAGSSDAGTGRSDSASAGSSAKDADNESNSSNGTSTRNAASQRETEQSKKSDAASTGTTNEEPDNETNAASGGSMRNAASSAATDATDAEEIEEAPVLKTLIAFPESVPAGATLAGISIPLTLEEAAGNRLILTGTTPEEEQISYDLGSAKDLNEEVVFSLTLLPDAAFEITSYKP